LGSIFLSYAREDRACVEKLAAALEAAGHDVWWDRRLDSGEEFSTEIEAALDRADVVVVAWSKDSVKSRWVRDEASIGGDSGRLVPITVDGTPAPLGFRQFHTFDLNRWRGSGKDPRIAELLLSLDRRLGAKAGGGAPAARTSPAPRQGSFAARLTRSRLAIVASLLLLIAGLAYFTLNFRASDDVSSKVTFAVLPFSVSGKDPALASIAAQARDATAHMLSDSGIAVRLVDSEQAIDPESIDFFLIGEIGGDPAKLVATTRLEDARQRFTVWSRRFEADGKQVADLPERIGAQVAGSLGWAGAVRMLRESKAFDPHLTADLLRQVDLTGDPLQSYQISKQLIEKWPKSGMAQVSAALNTGFVLPEIPRAEREEAIAAGLRAAERSRELIPDFGDTYIPSCLLQPTTRLAACEDSLRAGLRADPDAPFATSFLAETMANVGRKKEAFELARLTYAHDPYMPAKIGRVLRALAEAGYYDEAKELLLKAAKWWPDSRSIRFVLRGLIERGDYKAIAALQSELGPEIFPEDLVGIADVARAINSESLAALKPLCSSMDVPWLQITECMLGLASIGDLDGSFAIAEQLHNGRIGRTPEEEMKIWLDDPEIMPPDFITSAAAAPMRKDPRFLALAERTGLLRYWRSGRPPDFCRTSPEPICSSLLRAR
jgi:tetratricopeptide (TPR) repeat protein/TolB-like protein